MPKNFSFDWYRKRGRVNQPRTNIESGTANGGTSNPIFEKNLDIYLDSLKIAARLAFEEKSTVTIRDDYSGRSDEDLQYFIDHGKWRE